MGGDARRLQGRYRLAWRKVMEGYIIYIHTAEFLASVICGLTAEDRDQLRNPMLTLNMGQPSM